MCNGLRHSLDSVHQGWEQAGDFCDSNRGCRNQSGINELRCPLAQPLPEGDGQTKQFCGSRFYKFLVGVRFFQLPFNHPYIIQCISELVTFSTVIFLVRWPVVPPPCEFALKVFNMIAEDAKRRACIGCGVSFSGSAGL